MENMNRSKMIRDNRLIGIQQETLADRVMGRKGLTAAAGVYLCTIFFSTRRKARL